MLRFPAPADTAAVAFSPDGRLLAVAAGVRVHLHDAYTGRVERVFTQPTNGPVRGLDFAPDGLRLAVRHPAATNVWSVSAGRWLCGLPDSLTPPMFLPCGKRVATVAGQSDPDDRRSEWNRLWVWAALTGEVKDFRLRFVGGPLTHPVAVFAPAGGPLTVVQADRVRRFNLYGHDELTPTRLPEQLSVLAAAETPGGAVVRAARVSGRWLGRRRWDGFGVVDADGFRPLVDVSARPRSEVWAASPDGRTLARAEGETVATFGLFTGAQAGEIDPGVGPVGAVAFAPDGLRLAAAGRGGIAVWDADG